MTVMVTMMMRNAKNEILTAAMDLVSIALGFRMMQVAAAATATMAVMVIMFVTIAESLGYPTGSIHAGTMNDYSSRGSPRV